MSAASDAPFDLLLTFGSVGVDIDPMQIGASLANVTTCGKHAR